tara:strand:+ start:437 stop:577 length:141 start_codon:yes stop_codon:yes gene_type:complete
MVVVISLTVFVLRADCYVVGAARRVDGAAGKGQVIVAAGVRVIIEV